MKKLIVLVLGLFFFSSTGLLCAETPSPEPTTAPTKKAPAKKTKKNKKQKKTAHKKMKTAAVPATQASPATLVVAKKTPLEEWLKKMKKQTASMQTKQNKLVAVAAVRGSESEDPPPLYWKGAKTEGAVKPAEITDFEDAIDTALKGNNAEATTKLKTFSAQYPQSPLLPEVNETLVKLAENTPAAP